MSAPRRSPTCRLGLLFRAEPPFAPRLVNLSVLIVAAAGQMVDPARARDITLDGTGPRAWTRCSARFRGQSLSSAPCPRLHKSSGPQTPLGVPRLRFPIGIAAIGVLAVLDRPSLTDQLAVDVSPTSLTDRDGPAITIAVLLQAGNPAIASDQARERIRRP